MERDQEEPVNKRSKLVMMGNVECVRGRKGKRRERNGNLERSTLQQTVFTRSV